MESETAEEILKRTQQEKLRAEEENRELRNQLHRSQGQNTSNTPTWLIVLSVVLILAVGGIGIYVFNKDESASADGVAKVVSTANEPLLKKLTELEAASTAAMVKANAAAEDAKISEVEKAAILAPVNQRLDNLPTAASLNLEITKAVTEGIKPMSDRLSALETAKEDEKKASAASKVEREDAEFEANKVRSEVLDSSKNFKPKGQADLGNDPDALVAKVEEWRYYEGWSFPMVLNPSGNPGPIKGPMPPDFLQEGTWDIRTIKIATKRGNYTTDAWAVKGQVKGSKAASVAKRKAVVP